MNSYPENNFIKQNDWLFGHGNSYISPMDKFTVSNYS